MMAKDVKKTLDLAIEKTGVDFVHVVHRPDSSQITDRPIYPKNSEPISKSMRSGMSGQSHIIP